MLSDAAISDKLGCYKWYHKIPVTPGYTTPSDLNLDSSWEFIKSCMTRLVAFNGKAVLDIGCRDGLFSFFAEQCGAVKIDAIDNDVNPGSRVLAEIVNSRVRFIEYNLYDYATQKGFDIVLCFGVLYHLRYPFNGLAKMVDCTAANGTLCIETALYLNNAEPLLYCPYNDSPYEGTSVSFFNELALARALESLGANLISVDYQPDGVTKNVQRAFCLCRKNGAVVEHAQRYWNGTHKFHSAGQF